MQFKWDIKELETNKIKLMTLLNKRKNISLVKLGIQTYDEMLGIMHNNESINYESSLDDVITDKELFNKNFKCDDLKDIIDSSTNIFGQIKIPKKLINTNKNIDIYSTAIDFFEKMTDKKTTSKAYKILSPSNHILNIEETSLYRIKNFYTYDHFNKKGYISVAYTNTIYDLKYLVHEMFHYIFDNPNNNSMSSILLSEVEGLFANILVTYYLDKYNMLNDDEIYTIKSEDFIRNKISLYTLKYQDIVLNNLEDNKINLDKVNQEVSKYGIHFNDTNELLNAITYPTLSLIQYPIAFLIAIDLFYIYLYDRKYAFKLLHNIKKDTSCNLISILSKNNITFMKDDYTNLKKYIKTFNKKD